jgi:hypothetical protein
LLIVGCSGGGGSPDTVGQPTSGGAPVQGSGDPSTGGDAPMQGNDWTIVSGLGGCKVESGIRATGGLWTAEPSSQNSEPMRLLVAETGEFRWLPTDGWYSQVFGMFQSDGTRLATDDAVSVWVDGLTFLETRLAIVDVWADLDAAGGLTLQYEPRTTPSTSAISVLSACDSVYRRPSSLQIVAGTYVNGPQTLSIDTQGTLFYQSAFNHCVGQGRVEIIDARFNMYRFEIRLESCDRSFSTELNGLTYSGLGYLGDSGNGFTNDVAELALTALRNDRIVIWNLLMRR